MNVFQSAIDNWPEDEGRQEAAHIFAVIEDDADYDYVDTLVSKLPAHWKKVFASEADSSILMRRFIAAYNEHLQANRVPARFHLKD